MILKVPQLLALNEHLTEHQYQCDLTIKTLVGFGEPDSEN